MSKRERVEETPAASGDEPSKQELQRRMEEARESISETVAEIRDVVSQQYEEVKEKVEAVKEGVDEALDWREKFSENPLVWGAGAVSVGILIGLGLAQAFEDDGRVRRGKSKTTGGAAGHLVGELAGFAEAVLPNISGKVKELFGLDLAAYLHGARESAARKSLPAKRSAGKKTGAKKATTRKRAAEKKTNAKRVAGKKSVA